VTEHRATRSRRPSAPVWLDTAFRGPHSGGMPVKSPRVRR